MRECVVAFVARSTLRTQVSSRRTPGPITTGSGGTMTVSYASPINSAVWVPAFAGTTAVLGEALLPNHLGRRLIRKHRRWHEAAELAFDQLGQFERRAILEERSDDLHTDRKPVRKAERDRRRGQAGQGSDAGPSQLVGVRMIDAIDADAALLLIGRMVVRKGRGRHDRTDHGIEALEQRPPLRAQPGPRAVGLHPVAMVERNAAQTLGGEARRLL